MNKELRDLAWSVLPKEFKEEVKKLYAKFYNEKPQSDCSYGYLGLLIKIFGIHNLTSDAEGEEMLMISRKKVQRRYHMAYKCKHSVLLSHDDVQFWKGWQGALDDLFGSKCLPDEKVDPESLVTTIKDSMEHPLPDKMLLDGIAEQKPAEPKFKVGDYVRYKGGVHKVVATAKDNRCYLNKILGCIDESDLEPYTEPKENIAENRNLSQDCDKLFDNILKNSIAKERRLAIAAQMMQGLICAPLVPGVDPNPPAEQLAQTAFRLADALLAGARNKYNDICVK